MADVEITISIDKEIWQNFEKICANANISTDEAINSFLKAVISNQEAFMIIWQRKQEEVIEEFVLNYGYLDRYCT